MLKMILISFLGNLSSFAQSFAPFDELEPKYPDIFVENLC